MNKDDIIKPIRVCPKCNSQLIGSDSNHMCKDWCTICNYEFQGVKCPCCKKDI